jgi:hypothetical protein
MRARRRKTLWEQDGRSMIVLGLVLSRKQNHFYTVYCRRLCLLVVLQSVERKARNKAEACVRRCLVREVGEKVKRIHLPYENASQKQNHARAHAKPEDQNPVWKNVFGLTGKVENGGRF